MEEVEETANADNCAGIVPFLVKEAGLKKEQLSETRKALHCYAMNYRSKEVLLGGLGDGNCTVRASRFLL